MLQQLPGAVNHHIKPWGCNGAALTCYTEPQPVAHRKIRHCCGLFCAPFQHKDDIWFLTGDTSPGTPGVSSPVCSYMKLNSVSDSASPLSQKRLCHPQGTPLPHTGTAYLPQMAQVPQHAVPRLSKIPCAQTAPCLGLVPGS